LRSGNDILITAPPGSGKSALITIVRLNLRQPTIYIAGSRFADMENDKAALHFLDMLSRAIGKTVYDGNMAELLSNVVLIIDDAQYVYSNSAIWNMLGKTKPPSCRLLAAASYGDFQGPRPSTPWVFQHRVCFLISCSSLLL
jgi:hypothetical protein